MEKLQANLTLPLLESVVQEGEKKNLLPEGVFLNVVSKMVPRKKGMLRCNLPHRPKNFSVLLIVKDEDVKIPDNTIHHYDTLFKKNKDCGLPKIVIMPLMELTFSYQTFAAKTRLHASFDVFLVDKRIAHRVPSKLGSIFYEGITSKLPISVQITPKSISSNIAKALQTQLLSVSTHGSSSNQHIGVSDMPLQELKENILAMAPLIFEKWGDNIRSIYVQSQHRSVPIYFDASCASSDAVLDTLISTTERFGANLPSVKVRGSKKAVKKIKVCCTDRVSKVRKLDAAKGKIYSKLIRDLTNNKLKKRPVLKHLSQELMNDVAKELPPRDSSLYVEKKGKKKFVKKDVMVKT